MNIVHIALREVRATFTTAVGWLVLCAWLFLTGVFGYLAVWNYLESSQDIVYDPYQASQLTLTDWLFVPFFGNCAIVLLMFVPMLSMRVFAEETRQKTLELLLTSPVTTLEIVLGKYVGLLLLVAVMLAGTVQLPLALAQWAHPDPGALGAGYLGLFLLGAALSALGVFVSSLTSNQIVAALLAFAASLALFVAEWGSQGDPNGWMSQLSIMTHLGDLLRGAVKVSDVAYYVCFAACFLFATHQRVESFRWR